MVWMVWKVRNNIVFNNLSLVLHKILDEVKFHIVRSLSFLGWVADPLRSNNDIYLVG